MPLLLHAQPLPAALRGPERDQPAGRADPQLLDHRVPAATHREPAAGLPVRRRHVSARGPDPAAQGCLVGGDGPVAVECHRGSRDVRLHRMSIDSPRPLAPSHKHTNATDHSTRTHRFKCTSCRSSCAPSRMSSTARKRSIPSRCSSSSASAVLLALLDRRTLSPIRALPPLPVERSPISGMLLGVAVAELA